jgi:hypothetical protein
MLKYFIYLFIYLFYFIFKTINYFKINTKFYPFTKTKNKQNKKELSHSLIPELYMCRADSKHLNNGKKITELGFQLLASTEETKFYV